MNVCCITGVVIAPMIYARIPPLEELIGPSGRWRQSDRAVSITSWFWEAQKKEWLPALGQEQVGPLPDLGKLNEKHVWNQKRKIIWCNQTNNTEEKIFFLLSFWQQHKNAMCKNLICVFKITGNFRGNLNGITLVLKNIDSGNANWTELRPEARRTLINKHFYC